MMYEWPLINDNICDEDKEALVDFIKTPNVRFTNGAKVKNFESEWCEWNKVSHSTFVNSGASANYIMASLVRQTLTQEQLRAGAEVIVPSLCWVSDVSPIVNLGMVPVFVDVDPTTMSLDTALTLDAINDKTVAIVLVHGLGFDGLTDELLAAVKQHDIFLIEDCCEAHGATHNGMPVGTFGDVSNFSFYFGHHMTSVEGGMVCTDSQELDDYTKMYRSHGMVRDVSTDTQQRYIEKYPDVNPLFLFAVPGYNLRNNELNAVIASSQLPRLDSNIYSRRHNLDVWLDNLSSEYYWTEYKREGNSSFALPLVLKNPDKTLLSSITTLLTESGIEFRLGTIGGGNQARQPYLFEYEYDFKIHRNELPVADHIHDFGLYIGNHIELTDRQITNLVASLNDLGANNI